MKLRINFYAKMLIFLISHKKSPFAAKVLAAQKIIPQL